MAKERDACSGCVRNEKEVTQLRIRLAAEKDRADKVEAKKWQTLGECDECRTEYSYDPTDRGSVCVKCLYDKVEAAEKKLAVAERALEDTRKEVSRLFCHVSELGGNPFRITAADVISLRSPSPVADPKEEGK